MNEITQRDYLEDPLWARISEYPFDDPKASYPFSEKLADEQFWLTSFTARVLDEYRKFIYLCCINPRGASPSKKVDEAWHLHLTYTVDYWQRFCKETLEREIHHYPSTGGDAQKEKYDTLYRDTVRLYEEVFREEPPADIWDPPPGEAFPEGLVYEGMFSEKVGNLKYLLLLPLLLIMILYGQVNPFWLSGQHFLVFYGCLGITSAIASLLVIRGIRQKLKEVAEVLIPLTSTYELAYLAGGRDRFILSCLCDLIQGGYLTHTEGGKYKLAHNFREARHNPATKYLHGLDADEHYNLVQLEPYFVQAYLAVVPRFSKLVAQFEKPLLSRVLSGAAIFTGLLRIIQGSSNGKPVGYLFEMLFLVILVVVIMHRNNGFHAAFRSILDREVLAANRVVSNGELDVVFAGMNGLAGIIAADQLLYVYSIMDRKPESGLFNSSGCDGGGGSCGGGGCGGGCGGCGGS